jgi:prevent-host-death family protein
MSSVGVKELKNRLTHYLRRAKQGEEVIVTERGRPVALLQPIRSAKQVMSQEAKLAQLAAQGFLILPIRKPSRFRPIRAKGPLASRMILEDRR